MTRFFMTKKEAVDLIFWALKKGTNGETVIKKMKSVKIKDLLKAFLYVFKKDVSYKIKEIGIRVGEKLHEHLITEDEVLKSVIQSNYIIVKPYFSDEIEKNIIKNSLEKKVIYSDFSSESPKNRLSKQEIINYINHYLNESQDVTNKVI